MRQIAIVEDELEAKETLAGYLERYGAEHNENFNVTWFSNAIDFETTKNTFDLVFLDIQLPGINGMEAAQLLRSYDEQTPIIFVTNLAQYAVRGYEVSALDFIVKPVQYFNFSMRMDKALRRMNKNEQRSITVDTADGMRVFALQALEYVEINKHDLTYHPTEGAPVTVYGSLKAFEQEVAGSSFVRISNNTLVNMDYVRAVKGMELQMASGATLYFSRSRKKEAVTAITNFFGGSI